MEKKMDTTTKTEIDIAKAAPKRVVQKTAVATGDLIQNTIASKITLAGRTRSKEKKMKQMKQKKLLRKRQQIIYALRCLLIFQVYNIKMKYQK